MVQRCTKEDGNATTPTTLDDFSTWKILGVVLLLSVEVLLSKLRSFASFCCFILCEYHFYKEVGLES